MKYTDHFAQRSSDYLQFRPGYPDALFDYLSSLLTTHEFAWDCATGNGQAAASLSRYFTFVIATDLNHAQLDVAIKKDNISYHAWPAEKTKIPSASIDLITIAQALHYFDFTHFYQEAKRVLKPDGVIAAWCYSLGSISPDLDKIIKKVYSDILGNTYWPKERRYVDEQYHTIPFPFTRLVSPQFYTEKAITLDELLGYLSTWTAVKEYERRNNANPLDLVKEEFKTAWGPPETKHIMRWPIHLLVGKV